MGRPQGPSFRPRLVQPGLVWLAAEHGEAAFVVGGVGRPDGRTCRFA